MPGLLVPLRMGRYALLQADVGADTATLGVLLEDPESDTVHIRLRRDWDAVDAEDPVLPLLEDDLQAKAIEMGAAGFFGWLEEHLSANLRTSNREAITIVDFRRTLDRLYAVHVRSRFSEHTHVPRYSLRSAAGRFLENEAIEAIGWEELPPSLRLKDGMFAAEIVGTSMEPVVPDGSTALFQTGVTGSRDGRLVLVEEAGSRYTLKRYRSHKIKTGENQWAHDAITLEPLNNEHEALVLTPDETRYRIVAWFIDVLY